MQTSPSLPPIVYQLKVALVEISPLIWRRLLVRSDSSIADLHHIIQIAMGWEDIHLHRFLIHGREYGISRLGGICFDTDPHQVKLQDFEFRLNEKFRYEYDFGDDWQHEIRVEKILPVEDKKRYPLCTDGNRSAPPEDSGGVMAYWEEQPLAIVDAFDLAAELLAEECVIDQLYRERWREVLPWLQVELFDRKEVNRRLHLYAKGDQAWQLRQDRG